MQRRVGACFNCHHVELVAAANLLIGVFGANLSFGNSETHLVFRALHYLFHELVSGLPKHCQRWLIASILLLKSQGLYRPVNVVEMKP